MSQQTDEAQTWTPLDAVSRAMARRMDAAVQVPMAAVHRLVRMDAVLEHVARLKRDLPETTVTTLVVAAVARGLTEHPLVASSVDFDAMRRHVPERPGIGIAVSSDRGLVVPVVRAPASLAFPDLASEVATVITRARSGDRVPELFTGGHFTITNIAAGGVHGGFPIVNVPQAAILGIGTARKVPVVDGDRVVVGREAQFTVVLDHRVLDGMTASSFLATVAEAVEDPERLLG